MNDQAPHETPMAPVNRRPWIHSLAFGAVILVCGIAIGGVVTAVALHQPPAHAIRRFEHLPERIADDMQHKYNLTDEQKRKVQAVFEEHGKKLADIRAEVQPRVDAEHEALRNGVEAVLTSEQATQWRTEFEQMRRPWHFRPGATTAPERH